MGGAGSTSGVLWKRLPENPPCGGHGGLSPGGRSHGGWASVSIGISGIRGAISSGLL